jgi:DNA-binding FadR family transcriptional regulator
MDALVEDIRTGLLMPGMKIPSESALIERFGVSRTVVREAVSRMQAAGLVETHQGKGSFVLLGPAEGAGVAALSALDTPEDVAELIGLRLGVEVEGAGLAAANRSAEESNGLVRAAAAMRSMTAQTKELLEADFDFHRRIAHATGNRFYGELIDSLGPAMIAYPAHRLGAPDTTAWAASHEVICLEHEAIAAAIADGDVDSARAAMRLHLSNSRNRLTRRS